MLEEQAKAVQPQRIVEITGLLSEMEGQLRSALSVRTLVEMTLIRCARAASSVSLEEVLRKLSTLRDQVIRHLAVARPEGLATAQAVPERTAPQAETSAPEVHVERAPQTLPDEPEIEEDSEEEDLVPLDEAEAIALDAPPPLVVHSAPLKTTDGRYVDEIINHTLKLFGGTVDV